MWYILIGSVGIAATLYALWRAAKAETRAVKAEAAQNAAEENALRWKTENDGLKVEYGDQLARRDAEIKVLKQQKKEALDALENSPCPGNLRSALRLSLGVKA